MNGVSWCTGTVYYSETRSFVVNNINALFLNFLQYCSPRAKGPDEPDNATSEDISERFECIRSVKFVSVNCQ